MRSLKELMNLTGRRAIITGGAGHIALAIEETLVELGARVAVMDLDADACAKRVGTLESLRKGAAIAAPCDLADEQATRTAVRSAIDTMGGLEIVVHTAAWVGDTKFPGWTVPFPQQTATAFERAMRINLTSAFIAVSEARTALIQSGHGSIVFIGSTYGVVAGDFSLYEGTTMGGNPVGYGASKAGLVHMARCLSTILAPKVRVNSLSPGGVARNQPDIFVERYQRKTPLARMATEEDFKGAIAFLASDASAYVTGQNVMVDGGWTTW